MKESDYLFSIAGSVAWIVIFIAIFIIIVLFIAIIIKRICKIEKQNQEILKEISIKQDAIITELQLQRGYNPYNNYQQSQYYKDNKRNF